MHQKINAESQMINFTMLFLKEHCTQFVGNFPRFAFCFCPCKDYCCKLTVKYQWLYTDKHTAKCFSSMESKLRFPDSSVIKPSDDPLGKEKKTRLTFFKSSEGELKNSGQFSVSKNVQKGVERKNLQESKALL